MTVVDELSTVRLVLLFKMTDSNNCNKVEDSRRRLSFFFTSFLFSLLLSPLMTGSAQAAPLMVDVQGCITIPNDSARLACYDNSAAHDSAKEQRPSAAIAAPVAPVVPVILTITSELPQKITPRQAQTQFKVIATISEAKTVARGKWLLKLDNGQTWKEIEPGRNRYKVGQQVTIESGFMGSYSLRSGKTRARKFKPVY